MATQSNGYPRVAGKAWSTLRTRAANAPSTKLSPNTVAAMLGMSSAKSARDNIVAGLRRLGLVEEDGSLTARGNKWRLDTSYGEACQEILDEVYPEDLNSLVSTNGSPDAAAVKTWFDQQGYGDSNARQMASTYLMVARKTIPEVAAETPKSAPGAKKAPAKAAKTSASKAAGATNGTQAAEQQPPPPPADPSTNSGPNIHLDIQIHIPAEASPEQIDHIFASMARHLYGRDV